MQKFLRGHWEVVTGKSCKKKQKKTNVTLAGNKGKGTNKFERVCWEGAGRCETVFKNAEHGVTDVALLWELC